ncbi:MAG: RDD family protein [Candidatus Izemoplasmataceae bacterium]
MDKQTNAASVKGQRLVAAIVDYLIFQLFAFIAGLVLIPFIGIDAIIEASLSVLEGGEANEDFIQFTVITTLFSIVIGVFYYGVIPAKKKGQTIGKMFFHIKAIDEQGDNPSLAGHLKRAIMLYSLYLGTPALLLIPTDYDAYASTNSLLSFLTSGAVLVSLILLATRSDARGLHDMIAKSYVVDERFATDGQEEAVNEKEDPLDFNYDAWEDKDDPWS